MGTPVLLVGAGPAGISAAQWFRNLDVSFEWITGDRRIGGTLNRVGNPIDNYPGVPVGSGQELVARFDTILGSLELAPRFGVRLESLELSADSVQATLATGDVSEVVSHSYALLCTGTRPRLLGLAGEEELLGDGVEISVTRNLARYRRKHAVIVGGGDAALEGALLLAPEAASVTLVHRRETFRGQARFIDAVREDERIALRLGRHATQIRRQDGRLVGVELDDGEFLRADGLFERIGVAPSIPTGVRASCLDREGYLATDVNGVTAHPRLFAAGDVAGRQHQSVAWSVGSAARAASQIAELVG